MLQSGQSIADYEIVKPLAENQLYEAYQVKGPSGDFAKLLLIDSAQLADKKKQQAFIDQSKILLGQSFPGLCSLTVVVANAEHSYCLYSYPQGRALAEQLATALPVRRSLEIVQQVANSLCLPHRSGLWHGSISPSTIYLDDNRVSLGEFGLASLLRLDFNSGVDPCYSCPELVRGEQLGPAADLYSIGIVLYRLLTGAVPFSLPDPFATAMLHVSAEAAPLPESLSLLQPLLDGLLSANTGNRLSAEQLVAEIEGLLLLPEIEMLGAIDESQLAEPDVLLVETEKASPIEKLMESSAMATRIEERLKERAEVLQASGELTPDAQRASSGRLSAVGQQSYRKKEPMNTAQYQEKRGSGRLLILIVLGVTIGIALYLTLFGQQTAPPLVVNQLPEPLLAGLETGSRQLEEGDLAAAEKTFQGLADVYALYPQPYNNLAAISAKRGDLEGSRSFLERAMATDDAYVTVYRNLGTVYTEMARDSYGRALQLEKGEQAVTLQVFGRDQLLAVNSLAVAEKEPRPDAAVAVVVPGEPVEPVEPVVVAGAAPESSDSASEPTEVITTDPASATAVAEPVSVVTPIVVAVPGESVVEVPLAPEPEAAENFLRLWAAAWSAQDVDAYLGYYAAEYTPADGQGREAWAQSRSQRLTRPKQIDVSLDDFLLVRQNGADLQIEVTQSYKSDRYADKTRKLFDLSYAGRQWKIVRERSLGRVR